MTGIGRFVDATPAADPTLGQDLGPAAEAQPVLVAVQAAVAAAIGRQDRAATLLDSVGPSPVDDGAALLLAFARLQVARQGTDLKAFKKAYGLLVQHDPRGPFGTFARYEMGSLLLWQGSDHLADDHLQQALKQATEQSLHAIELECVGRLAIMHCSAGRVSVAEELVGQGTTLLQAHPWIPESLRVAYHLGAAEVALMRGDQDAYPRFMRLVEAELAPKADPALSCMTALIQATALQTAGRYAEAHRLLQTTQSRDLPAAWVLRTRAEILMLELQAQMGKPEKVLQQLELMARANEVTTSGAVLALARAHLAAGDSGAANRLLRRIITSRPAPPLPLLIKAMLLAAEVADAEGQETAAVEAATRAVQLASSERILQPFIAAGPRLIGVLESHPALTNLWPAPLENTYGTVGPRIAGNLRGQGAGGAAHQA